MGYLKLHPLPRETEVLWSPWDHPEGYIPETIIEEPVGFMVVFERVTQAVCFWTRLLSVPRSAKIHSYSLIARLVNHLPAMQETRVWFLGWEYPLTKEMATHSRTLAWRIPWAEEPHGLQSMEWLSQTWLSDFLFLSLIVDITVCLRQRTYGS